MSVGTNTLNVRAPNATPAYSRTVCATNGASNASRTGISARPNWQQVEVIIVSAPGGDRRASSTPSLAEHAFSGAPGYPQAGVILDSQSNLYGIPEIGGPAELGTAYRLSPPASAAGAWTLALFTSLHAANDGQWPFSQLVFGKCGVLYGTTENGGLGQCLVGNIFGGCGTVFAISR